MENAATGEFFLESLALPTGHAYYASGRGSATRKPLRREEKLLVATSVFFCANLNVDHLLPAVTLVEIEDDLHALGDFA